MQEPIKPIRPLVSYTTRQHKYTITYKLAETRNCIRTQSRCKKNAADGHTKHFQTPIIYVSLGLRNNIFELVAPLVLKTPRLIFYIIFKLVAHSSRST